MRFDACERIFDAGARPICLAEDVSDGDLRKADAVSCFSIAAPAFDDESEPDTEGVGLLMVSVLAAAPECAQLPISAAAEEIIKTSIIGFT
jgi:hypothetical protein